jgi:hypothetical protein
MAIIIAMSFIIITVLSLWYSSDFSSYHVCPFLGAFS